MASPLGREDAPLIEMLRAEPFRFEFFEAVRILERFAEDGGASGAESLSWFAVGEDGDPSREVVRFRSHPTLSFPAGSVVQISPRGRNGAGGGFAAPFDVYVSFLGLTGAAGVLPQHYTRRLIERIREKDIAQQDFFDLFNHRLVSFFFRAWEKYRLAPSYERAQRRARQRAWQCVPQGARGSAASAAAGPEQGEAEDPLSGCLFSLIGLGTGGLRGHLKFEDEVLLLYSGFFASRSRSAAALGSLLADHFGVKAAIEPFQGRWLRVSAADTTCLPERAQPQGSHTRLGVDTMLGERVWDVQSKFRVRLGPMDYGRFVRFLPEGDGLKKLWQLVRLYAGPELDFEVQVVIAGPAIPACELGRDGDERSCLGWNTWLRTSPCREDFEGAVFVRDEF